MAKRVALLLYLLLTPALAFADHEDGVIGFVIQWGLMAVFWIIISLSNISRATMIRLITTYLLIFLAVPIIRILLGLIAQLFVSSDLINPYFIKNELIDYFYLIIPAVGVFLVYFIIKNRRN